MLPFSNLVELVMRLIKMQKVVKVKEVVDGKEKEVSQKKITQVLEDQVDVMKKAGYELAKEKAEVK